MRAGSLRPMLFGAAALAIGGCEPPPETATPADTLAAAPPAVEEVREDTILIEGTPQAIRLQRYATPDTFPLPFTTWVPSDMVAELDPANVDQPGAGLRFIANFAGRRSPDAFLHLYVYPAGTTAQDVLAQARAFVASRGVPVSRGIEVAPPVADTVARQPWTAHEERFRLQVGANQWLVGSIALGEHAGRFFHLITQYPAEFGDGFGPRAAVIQENWRWTDNDAPLGG